MQKYATAVAMTAASVNAWGSQPLVAYDAVEFESPDGSVKGFEDHLSTVSYSPDGSSSSSSFSTTTSSSSFSTGHGPSYGHGFGHGFGRGFGHGHGFGHGGPGLRHGYGHEDKGAEDILADIQTGFGGLGGLGKSPFGSFGKSQFGGRSSLRNQAFGSSCRGG